MTDQKPERFTFTDPDRRDKKLAVSDNIYPILMGLHSISAQLDYLITMMYGQKQEEHHVSNNS